jgi:AraC-like DNA-binding protein
VRIERAKRELTQSDSSIAAISANVGFGPTMRMYQVFVRELGVTPSDYRKQRQEAANNHGENLS